MISARAADRSTGQVAQELDLAESALSLGDHQIDFARGLLAAREQIKDVVLLASPVVGVGA